MGVVQGGVASQGLIHSMYLDIDYAMVICYSAAFLHIASSDSRVLSNMTVHVLHAALTRPYKFSRS